MWLKRGLIDFACPMIYTPNDQTFSRQLGRILAEAGGKPVIAGVGVYDQGPWGAARKMVTARRMGAAGIALFSYDAIENEPSYWQSIRRAYLDLE